ncbi:MAG: c-type cytochrome [Verrucomicrobiales bacterium]
MQILERIFIVTTVSGLLSLLGCSDSERQLHAKGFHLPNGDFELGKEVFVEFKCHQCHTVAGVSLPDREMSDIPPVEIGGSVWRVRSYGELVTSIIDPDHVLAPNYLAAVPDAEREENSGRSPMPAPNDKMTVQQLVDLAAFLFTTYQKNEVEIEYYPFIP